MGAGDELIDSMILQGIKGNENPTLDTVCKSHEAIRVGLYALLLDAQDRRKKTSFDLGPIHATGWGSCILGAAYIICKLHGIEMP